MMNPDIIKMIDHFISLEFYEEHILHRSWFYLVNHQLLDCEKMDQDLLSLKFECGEPIFSLEKFKSNFDHLLCKIASCKKTLEEKHQMLSDAMAIFKFEND